MCPVYAKRLGIAFRHQFRVALWVRRVPPAGSAVGDPKAAIHTSQADNEVDVRIDLAPLVKLDWRIEDNLDRAIPGEIDLGARIAAYLYTGQDELSEGLDELLPAPCLPPPRRARMRGTPRSGG